MSAQTVGWSKGSPVSGDHTLDKLIEYCQRVSICTTSTARGSVVRVGNIEFSSHSHSTGCGVSGWIIDGDESFEFINTTYWYSSNYTFNDSKWIRGAWDSAVDAAINDLWSLVDKHRAAIEKEREARHAAGVNQQAELKARFERQFKTEALSDDQQVAR